MTKIFFSQTCVVYSLCAASRVVKQHPAETGHARIRKRGFGGCRSRLWTSALQPGVLLLLPLSADVSQSPTNHPETRIWDSSGNADRARGPAARSAVPALSAGGRARSCPWLQLNPRHMSSSGTTEQKESCHERSQNPSPRGSTLGWSGACRRRGFGSYLPFRLGYSCGTN